MLSKRAALRAGVLSVLMALGVCLAVPGSALAVRFVWRPGSLAEQHLMGGVVTAATCAPANLCVGVGQGGEVYASTDPTGGETAWTRGYVQKLDFTGVSCPTESLCVAVAQNGDVAISMNPAGPAADWRVAKVDNRPLSGVSCPTAGLCVAFDRGGNVLTNDAPDSGSGAWSSAHVDDQTITGLSCASTSLCVAVDTAGSVLSSSDPTGGAGTWNFAPVSSAEMIGVSCAQPSLCLAADGAGTVWNSTDPTGGAGSWHAAPIDADPDPNCRTCVAPTGVSCPSSQECLMIDSNGGLWTSEDPTGGPSSWSGRNVDALGGDEIFCGSPSLCVAFSPGGDTLAISQNPTGPSSTAWDHGAITNYTAFGAVFLGYERAVSCPAESFCAVADPDGNVSTSTDPMSLSATWMRAHITQGLVGLEAISCRPSGFCAALDSQGDVLVSHDPAAGASSWRATRVFGLGWDGLIACPSRSLCVVALGNRVAVSTDPGAGAPTWRKATVLGNPVGNALLALSCASTSLCVADDGSNGDVLISTSPAGGARAWKLTHLGRRTNHGVSGTDLGAVSCARRFCAVLSLGGIFTSPDATAARPAWRWTRYSFAGFGAAGISCASSSLCATASFANLFTSARPSRAGTWSAAFPPTFRPISLLNQVSCPTLRTCFALAGHGHMFVGRRHRLSRRGGR